MRGRWKVFVACTPTIMIHGMDFTMINVALPSMGVRLSAELADLQWVVAAFALAMVSLLPTSAAIGDFYGRRRVLLLGYGMLAAGAVTAWSATSMAVLLPGRIAQGIGMGLGFPNSLAMVALAFPREQQGRALGLWTAISSVVFTIGPIAGGWLVESFGFHAVFVPVSVVAAIGAAGTLMWIPTDRTSRAGRLDVAGIALGTGALSLISYALIEGGRGGFGRPFIVAALVGGLWCAGWFALHELRVDEPMLDMRLIRRPSFGPVLLTVFALHATTVAAIFFLTIYLQALRGFSPWTTGLIMLAFSGMVLVGAPIGGYLTDRIGFRATVVVALPVMGIAALLLGRSGPATPIGGYLLWGLALTGGITGALFVAASAAAVSGVPEAQTSAAAASLSASRQLGGVFGITLFGALGAIVTRARFRSAIGNPQDVAEHVSSMNFGVVPEGVDRALAAAASDASFFAFGAVMIVIGVGALVVGGLVLRLLFRKVPGPPSVP